MQPGVTQYSKQIIIKQDIDLESVCVCVCVYTCVSVYLSGFGGMKCMDLFIA